ncbi:MAG: glucose-1-phosphate adenylyltransferase subunit GlgD [Oscillospiraceae bacterium]|nr:glucose-1-phosphate adenylyltransferase subunit GlgD [Oscillospiraceae bacterium]
MDAMGIIFSNVYDSSMGALTEHRTSAAIPFGGRYRQIDFALSNMANAMIRHIGIITKYNYESLMFHLGSCEEWDLRLENTGVVILPPFATGYTGVYRGKMEALYTAMPLLEAATQEYAVLSGTTVLAAVDLKKALEAHIRSGCDITVITSDTCDGEREQALAIRVDRNGSPAEMAVHFDAPKGWLASTGMFIISRDKLIRAISDTVPRGKYRMERDFILEGFNDGSLRVNVWQHPGVAVFVENMQEFYEGNLSLLDEKVRRGLFHSDVPIYTKPRNEAPAYYGKNADVRSCLTADGCTLLGTCRRSVLFRSVTVERDAVVSESVVMQDSVVGEGAELKYVILDKDVQVAPGTKLVGSPQNPLYIAKGVSV